MNKLSGDFRTAMLGAANGIFTFSLFLLMDRIDSYYTYLSHASEKRYESDELWWVPGTFWQVLLFIVASFAAHRYLVNRCRSPFLLWQVIGVIALLGWLCTLSIVTGLESIMHGDMDPLERATNMFVTWFTLKFVAAVFAGNVIYSSLIQGAVSQYGSRPDGLGEA